MRKPFLLVLVVLFFYPDLGYSAPEAPTGLRTDLLERTEQVWRDGFPTTVQLAELPLAVERLQFAAIASAKPAFSWVVNDNGNNILQTAYEIQVATEPEQLPMDDVATPDCWSSGKVESDCSSSVLYTGKPLQPNGVYYWRVRTWNNGEVSPWSELKSFKMAATLADYEVSRYPIVKSLDQPTTKQTINERITFYDFGKASFGQLKVGIRCNVEKGHVTVRLGERVKDGHVDRTPAGSTRYAEYDLDLRRGEEYWFIKTRVDQRNTTGAAVLIPDYIGEVMPFRYVEVEASSPDIEVIGLERESAHYVFNDNAADFYCSDDNLNKVWNLCRYSIKATSFLGIFIDGDRERIPYEGDALLNQLSHYTTDSEYSLSRYSQQYMIFHPTWPTEWILQSVQMAWYDWLYTGDSRNIQRFYSEFKEKTLLSLADDTGLISTRNGKLTRDVLDSIHFSGKEIRDIVDWPHKGLAGNENADSGETDGFVFCKYNAVVNAYHYFALRSMAKFSEIADNKEDFMFYTAQMKKMKAAFQKTFFDPQRGIYKDGDTTDHASLHANMFALAFGLVPPECTEHVAEYIKERGMKCSVYGSQFFLDALYEGNEGAEALARMTTVVLRGWLNMITAGSTITMEAWDDRYKPNQDWNHAWGAAPANIIPRKLVGVEPQEPAFKTVRIKPQVADLTQVHAVVPTIRGPIRVSVEQEPGHTFLLTLDIPANITAEVYVPRFDGDHQISVNERKPNESGLEFRECGSFWLCPKLGSGHWTIQLTTNPTK